VVERPPAPPAGKFPQARSVQVAADGTVSAAFAPISCTKDGMPAEHDSLAERYELVDDRWRPTGETGFDVQTTGAGTATLRRGETPNDPGRLELTVSGKKLEIESAAEDLVAAP
jgi:hypothetical protein